MFYLTPPRHISTLPRLCENAKEINRDRTSHSFKTVSCAHIASAFNFEIEIKNIILVALRTFEFSHGLDPERKSLEELGRTRERFGERARWNFNSRQAPKFSNCYSCITAGVGSAAGP